MPVCHGAPASAGNQFPGKYLSLTSFKRDGSGVATPVWFVIENGRLLVKTDAQSFKVKRVRRNATVTIAPCTASGRLRGEPTPAHTELLPQSNIDHVDQLLARKYRVDKVLIFPLYRAMQKLSGAHARDRRRRASVRPKHSGIQREILSGFAMKIENVQGTKYGTGSTVAAEFKRQTTIKALSVAVHHTREEIGAGVA